MKSRILGVVKNIVRRTTPVWLRHRVWDLFVRRYFDRASIKAIVAYARSSGREQPIDVQRLITILQENSYQPVYGLINNDLNLDFKGYSSQDLIAYLYFNGKTSGFFIDIGAFDGVEISNTYALERLGWEGICIEPIPEIFSLLQKNRNCHKYNVAVSSVTKSDASFVKVSKLLGLSGLEQQMPERIKKGLEQQGHEVEKIIVNSMTFADVMKNHPGVDHVDFLSIDVEGGELDVLDTIDFARYRFGLITIENNAGTAILRDYMSQHGYVIFLDLGVDLMFIPG